MSAMAANEATLRAYLRLPPDSTEDVGMYLAAAKSQARSADIPDYKNNAQYDLFIHALAALSYDCRGLSTSNDESVNRMINSFTLRLRDAGEDPDPDVGDDVGEDGEEDDGI